MSLTQSERLIRFAIANSAAIIGKARAEKFMEVTVNSLPEELVDMVSFNASERNILFLAARNLASDLGKVSMDLTRYVCHQLDHTNYDMPQRLYVDMDVAKNMRDRINERIDNIDFKYTGTWLTGDWVERSYAIGRTGHIAEFSFPRILLSVLEQDAGHEIDYHILYDSADSLIADVYNEYQQVVTIREQHVHMRRIAWVAAILKKAEQ